MTPPGQDSLPRSLVTSLFHRWTWRMAWRDSRSQRVRLVIFSLAIVSGIAALVAIHSLKASVQAGIVTQAKALLGSDLQISSRRAGQAGGLRALAGDGAEHQPRDDLSLDGEVPAGWRRATGAGARDRGRLSVLREVETRPADAWQRLKSEPGILLEPALLDQFQAKVGDEVELGGLRLQDPRRGGQAGTEGQPLQRLRAGSLCAAGGRRGQRPAREEQHEHPPAAS